LTIKGFGVFEFLVQTVKGTLTLSHRAAWVKFRLFVPAFEPFLIKVASSLEKIEVEFIVLKRKLYENADFTIPRTQSIKPAAGKTKMKQAEDQFNEFLDTCFTEDGIYIHKEYPMNISKESCTWCPYNNGLCTKGESKTTFFS
jgi:hypothetical protein